MVTIKDISKACGYSVSTVSKALNNSPEIGKDKRINKTASEMGYLPNLARLLKTNAPTILSIVC